jgi:NADH-quinone oxidoreductase subunit F
VTEPREGILFKHFDTPNRQRIEVYEELGGYRALRKALTEMTGDQVLKELEGSGLRGRGGAGFSMGKKASFLPHGEIDKYLCCNADESEPGAFKDRELIHRNPHQLIEGVVIAAYAAGIRHAFIYIRGEYVEQAETLERAVAEAEHRGYIGDDILASGFSCSLVVHRGAGAYICGEETALLDSLEGKRGNPRLRPPFPANQGLYQGPTLINNVETLSNVSHIIEHGTDWFRRFGTERSPGTKVVSVSGNVQRPGNYEVELGVPSRQIIFDLAGGPPPGRRIKCWFPGGSSSPVLTEEHLDLPYDFEHMAEAGSMLGSGSIIIVDDSVPIVDVATWVAKFYRHESCGKCVPCREGTNWTVKMLERIDSGDATPLDLEVMESVQENITGNCLCLLGDSMAMPIASMIKRFRPEFEEHIAARQRAAGRVSAGTTVQEPDLVGAATSGPGVEAHPQAARTDDRQVPGHGGSA